MRVKLGSFGNRRDDPDQTLCLLSVFGHRQVDGTVRAGRWQGSGPGREDVNRSGLITFSRSGEDEQQQKDRTKTVSQENHR